MREPRPGTRSGTGHRERATTMRDLAPPRWQPRRVPIESRCGPLHRSLLCLAPIGPEEPSNSGLSPWTRVGLFVVAAQLLIGLGAAVLNSAWSSLVVLTAVVASILIIRAATRSRFAAVWRAIAPRGEIGPRRIRPAALRALTPLRTMVLLYASFWWVVFPARAAAGASPELLCVLALPCCWYALRAFVLAGPGDLDVEFAPHPARAGEPLRVRIATGARGAAVRRMELRLLCLVRDERHRAGPASVAASDRVQLAKLGELPEPGGAIDVEMRVPVDAPAGGFDTDAMCVWRLDIRIWCGLGSFTEMFVVPVQAASTATPSCPA